MNVVFAENLVRTLTALYIAKKTTIQNEFKVSFSFHQENDANGLYMKM